MGFSCKMSNTLSTTKKHKTTRKRLKRTINRQKQPKRDTKRPQSFSRIPKGIKRTTKKFKITTRRLKMITKKHKTTTETHRDDGDKKQHCVFCVSFHLQDDFWDLCCLISGAVVSETSTTALFYEHHDAAWSRCTAVILTSLLSVDTTIPFHSNVPTVSPVLFLPADKSTKPPSTSPS